MALSRWIYDTQDRKIGNSKILFPTVFEKAQVIMKTHFVDIKTLKTRCQTNGLKNMTIA